MGKQEVYDLAKDGLEFAIDNLTDSELVKSIPVVNTAVGLLKIGTKTIPDYLFAKKLSALLVCLESVSDKTKENIKNFAASDKNAGRLGENILNIINRASDEAKVKVIANLFIAYLDQEIDENMFRRLIEIVDSTFIDDLLIFLNAGSRLKFSSDYKNYQRFGLGWVVNTVLVDEIDDIHRVRLSTDKNTTGLNDKTKYRISGIGKKLVEAYNYGHSFSHE